MSRINQLKKWARRLKKELHALFLAYHDPRTPWFAKVMAICVVAYALSPIDLIPDFIPIIGYLDDLILLPIGIYLTLKFIPDEVMLECRKRADEETGWTRKTSWIAGAIVLLTWILAGAWIIWRIWKND
jgi:uncharacterized membrane protein YkvA (DUF1232 family)